MFDCECSDVIIDFKIETFDDLRCWHQMNIEQKTKAKHKVDEGFCFFCYDCKKDKSIRKDAIFENSSKTFSNWIDFTFTFSTDSVIGQGAKLSSWETKRRTVRCKKFRKCCGKFLDETFEALHEGQEFENKVGNTNNVYIL